MAVSRTGYDTRILGPPDIVGLLGLLGDTGAPGIVAETDVFLLELSSYAEIDLLEEQFPFLVNAIRLLARELAEARSRRPDFGGLVGRPVPSSGLDPCESLDLVERLVRLRKMPAFTDAGLESLAEVARGMHEVRLPAGEVLWRQGDRSEQGIVIVHGRATCRTEAIPDGFVVGPGFGLGFVEAFGAVPYDYTPETATEMIGLVTDMEQFFDVLEDHSLLGRNLLKYFSRRLVALFERPVWGRGSTSAFGVDK